jgi:hypothetical protein
MQIVNQIINLHNRRLFVGGPLPAAQSACDRHCALLERPDRPL